MPDRPIQASMSGRFTWNRTGRTPQAGCYIRDRGISQQRFAGRTLYKTKDFVLIPEAYLGLGRVDVDVDQVRRHVDEQDGLTPRLARTRSTAWSRCSRESVVVVTRQP